MDADDTTLPGRFHSQLRALQGADLIFSPIIGFWEAHIGSVRVCLC